MKLLLFGPGQIHLVQGPGGTAARLGTGEKLWVQRAAGNYDQMGKFSQTLNYIAPGAMTWWQVIPQNFVESRYPTPL